MSLKSFLTSAVGGLCMSLSICLQQQLQPAHPCSQQSITEVLGAIYAGEVPPGIERVLFAWERGSKLFVTVSASQASGANPVMPAVSDTPSCLNIHSHRMQRRSTHQHELASSGSICGRWGGVSCLRLKPDSILLEPQCSVCSAPTTLWVA
jgi:hypothetical protein